jgi:5-methylcytosine-specific restriction protein A
MPTKPNRVCGCGRTVAFGARCPCMPNYELRRPNATERGYDAWWRAERDAFLKVNTQCKRCGDDANVVDHVIPHRGDRTLLWDRSNWQPLCTSCHARWKQSSEAKDRARTNGGRGGGGTGLFMGTLRPVPQAHSIKNRNKS